MTVPDAETVLPLRWADDRGLPRGEARAPCCCWLSPPARRRHGGLLAQHAIPSHAIPETA